MRTFFIVLLSFHYLTGFSQNLVKNSSFEYFTADCNEQNFGAMAAGNISPIQNWFSLNESCFYLNTCSTWPGHHNSIPNNVSGFQYPRTGEAYIALTVYYYESASDIRGYIRGEFEYSLIKDSVYCVEYYVCLAERVSNGAIMNVDAFISDTIPRHPPWIQEGLLLELPAQIKSKQILNDSINWTRVGDLYKARGGERYITIGNFQTRERTTKISWSQGGDLSTVVHYFLDDVSVAPAGVKAPALGPDTVLCRNAMPYRLTAPAGYDSYQWSTGQSSQSIDVYDQGKYTLTCSLGDCGSLSDEIVISFDAPVLNLENETTICWGDSAHITAPAGFMRYNWSNGDTTQSISVAEAGTYYLQTTDRCGTQLDSIKVLVDTIPTGTIKLGNDTTTCRNGKDFPIVLSSNTELPNYFWSNGDTTKQTTISNRGSYSLTSKFRCGDVSDEIFVDVCPPEIAFPNAFKPDDDGLNDTFGPIQTNMFIHLIQIYNGWGQMVFEGKTPDFTWNGKIGGRNAPEGIYAYIVYYSDYDASNRKYLQKGLVVLLR